MANVGTYQGGPPSSSSSSHWVAWMLLGIALILLGILALGSIVFTSTFTVLLLGWLLLIVGVIQFFAGFFVSHHKLSTVLLGLLYAIVGFLMVVNPATSLATLTLLIAVALTIGGLVRTIAAFGDEGAHRGWRIFGGLVTLALGILVWVGWPESSLYFFGLFIGIDLVLAGVASIVASVSSKRLQSA